MSPSRSSSDSLFNFFSFLRNLNERQQSRRTAENISARSEQHQRQQLASRCRNTSNAENSWFGPAAPSSTLDGIARDGNAVPGLPNWTCNEEQQQSAVDAADKRKQQQKITAGLRAAANGLPARNQNSREPYGDSSLSAETSTKRKRLLGAGIRARESAKLNPIRGGDPTTVCIESNHSTAKAAATAAATITTSSKANEPNQIRSTFSQPRAGVQRTRSQRQTGRRPNCESSSAIIACDEPRAVEFAIASNSPGHDGASPDLQAAAAATTTTSLPTASSELSANNASRWQNHSEHDARQAPECPTTRELNFALLCFQRQLICSFTFQLGSLYIPPPMSMDDKQYLLSQQSPPWMSSKPNTDTPEWVNRDEVDNFIQQARMMQQTPQAAEPREHVVPISFERSPTFGPTPFYGAGPQQFNNVVSPKVGKMKLNFELQIQSNSTNFRDRSQREPIRKSRLQRHRLQQGSSTSSSCVCSAVTTTATTATAAIPATTSPAANVPATSWYSNHPDSN